jgi:hypothetical protein
VIAFGMKSQLGHGGGDGVHRLLFPLRFLFTAHPLAMGKVLGIVYRAIATRLSYKAGYSIKEGATVAVTLIQRFGKVFRKVVGPLVLLTLSFTPVSVAEIFKCVDEATGNLAFTDQACPNDQSGNHLPVGSTNFDGGFKSSAPALAPKKREAEESELLQNWQTHNAGLQRVLDRERAKEEEERAQEQRIRDGE